MEDPSLKVNEWNSGSGADSSSTLEGPVPSRKEKGLNLVLQWIRSIKNLVRSCKRDSLDLEGPVLHIRNIILTLFIVTSLSFDHIFLYVPLLNDVKACIQLDKRLGVTAVIFRSIIDLFYIGHIISKFCPLSHSSWLYVIDIIAVLPLPQVIILSHFHKLIASRLFNVTDLLKFVILLQYFPRLYMIYPLGKKVTKAAVDAVGPDKVAWVKAAVNFFLYMLVSHVIGAFWFLFSIERVTRCWQKACKNSPRCVHRSFYCDSSSEDNTYLKDACPMKMPNTTFFDFGIFLDALQSGIVGSKDFPEKFSYCFWWGLQNLSSLGQNLKTSTYFWENCFAVFISLFGLAVFLLFIGDVQVYLQSKTMRVEEKRLRLEEEKLEEEKKSKEKRIELEQLMESFGMPHKLKFSIRQHLMNEWLYTGGVNLLVFTKEVNLKNLIHDLPLELKRHATRFLSRGLLRKVSVLSDVSEKILDLFSDHLQPVVLDTDDYFIKEGEPLDKMLFVMRGTVRTFTRRSGIDEALNAALLSKDDLFGVELLRWVLNSPSSSHLPESSRNVQAVAKVEAFVLVAKDIKAIISKYWWHFARKFGRSSSSNLEHWKPMAASAIKFALLRRRKKRAKTASVEELAFKRQDREQLMAFHMLPLNLKQQIKELQPSDWDESRGVDVVTLLRILPTDFQRDVKRHLCVAPLKKVALFMRMGDQCLDQLCDCLKPVYYLEHSHIIREGDPIKEMVFVVRGRLWAHSTTSDKNEVLTDGCACGEELVQWTQAASNWKLPISSLTIQALTNVEVFSLPAGDLKLIMERMAKVTSIIKQAYSRYKRRRDGHKKDAGSSSSIVHASKTGTSTHGTPQDSKLSKRD